jgi:hypothetical protein
MGFIFSQNRCPKIQSFTQETTPDEKEIFTRMGIERIILLRGRNCLAFGSKKRG